MDTHKPLDLVIIFLGTNDLKSRYHATAADIANGVEVVARAAFSPAFGPGNGKEPDILVICPPSVWEVAAVSFGPEFKGAREKSFELRGAYREMSKRTGLPLLYAEDFVGSDPLDGIHLSQEDHSILAQEMAKWILEWSDAKARTGT